MRLVNAKLAFLLDLTLKFTTNPSHEKKSFFLLIFADIRVQEALRDDIPHPDQNRGYNLALKAAGNSGLLVINGTEITRSMPPGRANAIFVNDVSKMLSDDYMESFREAKRQGALIFAKEKTPEAMREAMFEGRSVVL